MICSIGDSGLIGDGGLPIGSRGDGWPIGGIGIGDEFGIGLI